MLTRRGRTALVLAVVFLLAGRLLGITELFGLAVASVVVVLAGLVRVRAPSLSVSLTSRLVPAVIAAGEPATLQLSIENSGGVPTPTGRLRLVPATGADGPAAEVPRLVPGEKATVSLRLRTDRRGRHQVTGYEVVLTDALGTCSRRLSSIPRVVYGVRPTAEHLTRTLPAGEGGADAETTRSAAERLRSGSSLLRPYMPGDDLRLVHWPTTARVGEIMVREGGDRELDASSGACVVLSNVLGPGRRATDGFEDAVSAAASLLSAAEAEGSFRLIVDGGTDTAEGAGGRHLESTLDVLIDVTAASFETPRFATSHRGGAVFGGKVTFFVAACDGLAELEQVFGGSLDRLAARSSAVIGVCAGAKTSAISRLDRRCLLVSLASGASLEQLWAAGEPSLVGP